MPTQVKALAQHMPARSPTRSAEWHAQLGWLLLGGTHVVPCSEMLRPPASPPVTAAVEGYLPVADPHAAMPLTPPPPPRVLAAAAVPAPAAPLSVRAELPP